MCEAGCGLLVETTTRSDTDEIVRVRANVADRFSRGHICAKGIALQQLHDDPQRLRQPLVRGADGLQPASWAEAYAVIEQRLNAVRDTYGNAGVATYIGNPTAHNVGLSMGMGVFLAAVRGAQIYSAGSVDQLPKQLACALLFGNDMAIPVPDIERTDCLIVLGANPAVSNGSLWMVPGVRSHLRELRRRGGRLVVVDPRRSETARLADEHLAVPPATDVFLLLGLIQALLARGYTFDARYPVTGAAEFLQCLRGLPINTWLRAAQISESTQRRLLECVVAAERPVFYGRVGTTVQQHGTLTSFLVEVLNLLCGSLDTPGGAMFPEQAFVAVGPHRGELAYNRFQSRVSGYPEVLGQMPVAALAEEIETPGEGQVRALVCFAGNPLVSNPHSDRLQRALQQLDFLLCVDLYVNETSQWADVILPGTSPFVEGHYDNFLGAMGWRNVARYSAPPLADAQPQEWQIGLTLAYLMTQRAVPDAMALQAYEDQVVSAAVAAYCADPSGLLHGRDAQAIYRAIEPAQGVERLLDLGIRAGPWGDQFGLAAGLTLEALRAAPDGVDFGAPRAGRLTEVIRHQHGCIDLAPAVVIQGLRGLAAIPGAGSTATDLQLIGRRSVHTNNSWLHNLPMLNRARPVCELEMHPRDAEQRQIASGQRVTVSSSAATVRVTVRVTDAVSPGVVCLPHGFSETPDVLPQQSKGANYNRLVSADAVDALSGTSALNGVRVQVSPAAD